MGLPNSYKPAAWRCTTRIDDDARLIGFAFNLEDGSVVRLALPLTSAAHVAGSVFGFLNDHLTRVHSSISSGSPSVDVSVAHEVEKVCPPDTSSTACCGVE